VANKLADIDERSSGGKLMGNEGMAEVVDFGIFNTGKSKETINTASNVTNQERVTGFGDEDVFGIGFGTVFEIEFESLFSGDV